MCVRLCCLDQTYFRNIVAVANSTIEGRGAIIIIIII